VGATATVRDGALHLTAAVYSLDGTRRISASHTIPHRSDAALTEAAVEAARVVTEQLLGDGAADLAPVGARGDA
jgi:hydroxymethylbilane synthase